MTDRTAADAQDSGVAGIVEVLIALRENPVKVQRHSECSNVRQLCTDTPADCPVFAAMRLAPEQEARERIDALLTTAGWVIQDNSEFNRNAAEGVAVREFMLPSGPCDYL